jgi:hypothetical protein
VSDVALAARPGTKPSRLLLVVAVCISAALLVAQVVSGWHILHSADFFTALAAKKYVWANAAAAVLVCAFALGAPGGWRWLAVAGPGGLLVVVLIATAIPGGQGLGLVFAALTMAALWDTGGRLLRRLGAHSLARLVPVAWLAGIGPWSLGTLLLGWLSLLRWWTVGILLIVVGTIGIVRLTTQIRLHRQAILGEITGSTLGLASAGLILLTCAWAAIYTAAPELQFDALYVNAYLPELWAHTGHIGSLSGHVQFELDGWFQLLATYGHMFGGPSVGRYMQLTCLLCVASAVWWWGRRHGALGPIAAVAVAVTPHLLWQAGTADDDLLLALAAFALCLAVVESLQVEPGKNVRGVSFAIGLMAGCAPSLKLHAVPLFALLALGWIVAGHTSRTAGRRLSYAAMGAAITALPPLVARWIDTGNPVIPALNNIFRSPYWLPVNETVNFPWWSNAGTFGPIKVIWEAVVNPSLMVQDAPPGAFGILVGAIVFALLFGWRGRDRSRASLVIWAALLLATAFWWITLRYLRYLLPTGLVSVALALMLTAGVTIGRRGRLVGVIAITLATIASFPVTIGQFWNVPNHKPPVYAAIGRWNAASYENTASPERPAILAFNRLSPPGTLMASDAFERIWLTGGRDFDSLYYDAAARLELHGPVPTNGDQSFADLRAIGIAWALVTESSRQLNQQNYLSEALTTHGKIEFSARGWDLYRLVDHPPQPVPVAACDRVTRGVPPCWGGPQAPNEPLTVGVTRIVPACDGQILAVTVSQAGGAPSPVLIRFAGGDPALGVQPGGTVPGLTQRIYATAPPGATSGAITISPSPGARITSASIGRLGPACHAPA